MPCSIKDKMNISSSYQCLSWNAGLIIDQRSRWLKLSCTTAANMERYWVSASWTRDLHPNRDWALSEVEGRKMQIFLKEKKWKPGSHPALKLQSGEENVSFFDVTVQKLWLCSKCCGAWNPCVLTSIKLWRQAVRFLSTVLDLSNTDLDQLANMSEHQTLGILSQKREEIKTACKTQESSSGTNTKNCWTVNLFENSNVSQKN